MIHDKDILPTGEPKKRHLHCFVELHEKATFNQFLAELGELLGINTDAISLEASNSPILGIQYLTHKNDQDKYQYNFEDIKTNNQEKLEMKYYGQYVSPQEKLFKAMTTSKSMLELTEKIGIDNAIKVRALFNQIKQEQGANLEAILHYQEKVINATHELEDKFNKLVTKLELFFKDKQELKTALELEKDFSQITYLIETLIFEWKKAKIKTL